MCVASCRRTHSHDSYLLMAGTIPNLPSEALSSLFSFTISGSPLTGGLPTIEPRALEERGIGALLTLSDLNLTGYACHYSVSVCVVCCL